ncbi:hypothetical protein MMC24_002170 [Lignoscripta atroalba]|nr:hypothetical protein [Lignoscripta atroalba]
MAPIDLTALLSRAASLPGTLPTDSAPAPVEEAPPTAGRGLNVNVMIVAIVVPCVIALFITGLCVRRQLRRRPAPQAPKTSHQQWIRDSQANLENGAENGTYRGVSQAKHTSWRSSEGYFGGAGDSEYNQEQYQLANMRNTTTMVVESTISMPYQSPRIE